MKIDAFIYDPDRYSTKRSLYEAARGYVRIFPLHAGIENPAYQERSSPYYGFYRKPSKRWRTGCISIHLDRCKTPVKTPGFSWSYPGYKADLTPAGVLAHEMGHHLFANVDWDRPSLKRLIEVVAYEAPVSSYEPTVEESFCEAAKLFILNPMLLRAGRPRRYDIFTSVLGLSPMHEESWELVLAYAHPKLLAAARKWIERA